MNKKELIQAAAAKVSMPQIEISKALTAILETITESLTKKEPVRLTGFGSFSVRGRKARNGINPATKKPITIAAKNVVVFKASKKQ